MRENKKKMKMKKKSGIIWQGSAYVCTVPMPNNKDINRIKNEEEGEIESMGKMVTIYAKFSIEYITNTIHNNVDSKIEFIKLQIPFWNFIPSSAPHFTVQLSSFIV